MKRHKSRHLVLALVAAIATGCGTAPAPAPAPPYEPGRHFLSEGSSIQGRKDFIELGCNRCHSVAGDHLPVASPMGTGPELGHEQISQPVDTLVNSIMIPSHSISKKPGPWEKGSAEMVDYTRIMTVRQLMDVIAYIKSPKAGT